MRFVPIAAVAAYFGGRLQRCSRMHHRNGCGDARGLLDRKGAENE